MDSNAVFAAATASLLSGKEFEDLRNHFGLTKVDMAVISVAMQKHGTLGAMYQNEPAMFAVLSLKLRPVLQAMQKHLDLGMKMQMIWFSKADFGSFQKAAEYLMVQNVLRTLQQEMRVGGLLPPPNASPKLDIATRLKIEFAALINIVLGLLAWGAFVFALFIAWLVYMQPSTASKVFTAPITYAPPATWFLLYKLTGKSRILPWMK